MKSEKEINKTIIVNMQPIGRRVTMKTGVSLLEVAQSAGVELMSICGGVGACDTCKIRLVSGDLSPLTPTEKEAFTQSELGEGYRLACQAFPLTDVKIEIPPDSLTTPQRLQVEGEELSLQIEPAVVSFDLAIQPPTINDLRSDATRLIDSLKQITGQSEIRIGYPLLMELSEKIRSNNWHANFAMRNEEIIACLPYSKFGEKPSLLGLAIDIGTTKVAAYLVDLTSGKTISKTGAMNPQIAFGEDVISRIAYANAHDQVTSQSPPVKGRNLLQSRLIDTLNTLIINMCEEAGSDLSPVSPHQIVEAVIVGNTAMHHFFAGLPVNQLGASPYVPAVSESMEIEVRDIGLEIAPGAYIYLPPNIAGYVGADHVAMLLATVFSEFAEKTNAGQSIIALDIGTNTEISLVHKGELLCCSCASGPAFEGAHIRDGMRAAPGAIERVQISEESVRIKTIGDQPPVGICGSGILDSISEMRKAGIIDYRGSFIRGNPRVRSVNDHCEYLLAPAKDSGHNKDIVVTRKDVNEIQLAKGAIRAGIDILLATAGIKALDIDQFIIAGAFGTYIDIKSAINIGMFPTLPLEKFHQVGNAAGMGAKQMLLSKTRRKVAKEIISRIKYIELSNHPDFTDVYSRSLFFPV